MIGKVRSWSWAGKAGERAVKREVCGWYERWKLSRQLNMSKIEGVEALKE